MFVSREQEKVIEEGLKGPWLCGCPLCKHVEGRCLEDDCWCCMFSRKHLKYQLHFSSYGFVKLLA